MTPQEIETRDFVFETMFTNHPPENDLVASKFDAVTALVIQFAKDLDDQMPETIGNDEYTELWNRLRSVSQQAKYVMAIYQSSY